MEGFRPVGRWFGVPVLAALAALALGACVPKAGPVAEPVTSADLGYQSAVLDRVARAWQPPGDVQAGARPAHRRPMPGGGDTMPTLEVPRGSAEEGVEVEVALTLSNDGQLKAAQVSRSSGDPTYDAAALQSAWDGGPYPPVPDSLRGGDGPLYQFSVRFVAY